ncbi:MAG: hypothetical protein IPJ65_12170 [Archangiaceae bacterium]|nr:hypothetical protein [Archangiaceae bacterium]
MASRTAALPSTPTADAASKAWTQRFAAAVRDAAGSSGRLTAAKAATLTGPFADNVRNFFDRTGQKSASVAALIDSGARYVRAATAKAAGPEGKLSLTEIKKKLPEDLVTDMLWLRGKVDPGSSTTSPALTDALAALDISEITDYGKRSSLTTYPSNTSLADVLRAETGWDDPDADVIKEFKGTKGDAAAREFQADMADVGSLVAENADTVAIGKRQEKLFRNLGAAAVAEFTPASRFASLEYGVHGISEDGDIEFRLLVAKEKSGAWKVLQYQDFPF